MPQKSSRRKNKGSGRAPASARPAALDPPSGDATPDNDGEDGTPDDAGSGSEIREAEPREATSSIPRFSQNKVELLEEEIMLLRDRLATARFESRGASDSVKRSTWKPQSLRSLPFDTPSMTKPGSLLALRRAAFGWLGSYSFVLRLAQVERAMMSATEFALHRDNRAVFLAAWTQASLTQLQMMCTWS